MNPAEGEIFCVDKPLGWTSFDVVKRVRHVLSRRMGVKKLKVGHAGTLDPLATGVMILATGRCTKRIEELQSHTKEYVATLRLGATTPSFDLETEIDCERPWEHISLADVEAVLPMFVGRISQVPPAYSACKVDGKRAYKMARKGKEVSIRPKELLIESIELLPSELPEVAIRVVCGKGTYIRALARDIGERLGCGAHLTALRRTKVGDIAVEQCETAERLLERLRTEELAMIAEE
ncbi:MAG TPA: tRNA pseudouridine(55) synthase TruB [Candidatus Limisoma intestinavium]|uniref:tRNA pseudouridine synthase B n=1 Tax=Candidatus Limisoma intestinavium TaxID=2840856 RepID=A0A9D1LFL5_9BACT|nr:tRNA pseudouridine(55) synthase TruB [Candidatus Limisoma intestinavium]